MNTTNQLKLAAAVLVLAAGAATAFALPDPEAEEGVRGSYNRPLRGARVEAPPAMELGGFTMMMSHSDGTNSYTLRMSNGNVSAEVNGKPVPEDRIRRDRDKIAILGERGEVLHEFRVGIGQGGGGAFFVEPPAPPRPPQTRIQRDPQGVFRLERADPAFQVQEAPPPVMIGITMAEPDAGVLDFLGVESAIRIDRIVKELPGDKAGLREGDVITQVNGKPASQQSLRELLKGAKPGDELTLRVFRKGGESRDFKLTLAAFDQSKLASIMPQPEGVEEPFMAFGERFGPARDEAVKRLDEALKIVREKVDGRRLQEELVTALERAREAFRDAQDKMQHFDWRQFLQHDGQGFFGEPGRGRIFTVPAPGLDETDRRREELSRRVDQLDGRLDEINRRLDELRELMRAQAAQRPPRER